MSKINAINLALKTMIIETYPCDEDWACWDVRVDEPLIRQIQHGRVERATVTPFMSSMFCDSFVSSGSPMSCVSPGPAHPRPAHPPPCSGRIQQNSVQKQEKMWILKLNNDGFCTLK